MTEKPDYSAYPDGRRELKDCAGAEEEKKMTLPGHVRDSINRFFTAIEPLERAYTHDSFSYFAVRNGDKFVLIQGILFLNIRPPSVPFGSFSSENVKAGHFLLKSANLTPKQFVDAISSGTINTPIGALEFPSNGGHYGASFQPFHEVGIKNQNRLTHLTVLGDQTHSYFDRVSLDWELRSASTPYDGLQDLLNEFQLGILTGVNKVEVAAFSLVGIENSSTIEGEIAKLIVNAAPSANTNEISIGYTISERGKITSRKMLDRNDLSWELKGNTYVGVAEFAVPKASIVHAFASYNGMAQQHYYIVDPKSFQNPRRAVYEAFDPKLELMMDIFAKAKIQREQRNFEAMIDWLFWMLGFAPASIGQTARSSDAPDFVIVTPDGHLAVVECTVGLLKEDRKLPTLHDRVQAVLRNLKAANLNHIRVLPVIVTAKSIGEIRPELSSARSQGAHVMTRETIDSLLLRTLLLPNANQIYLDAEAEVSAALATDLSEPELNFRP